MVEIAKRLVFYDIPHIVACWISIQARAGYPATWLPEFLDFAKTGVFAHFWCFCSFLVFLGYFGVFAILAYFGIFPQAGVWACR